MAEAPFYEPTEADRERYKDLSICILTPIGGYDAPAPFVRSVVNMVAYSWHCGLRIYQMGTSERMVVDWARNALARAARVRPNEYTGEPFTHLLWLDDDHVFNPDLAVWLVQNAHLDMVSALYYGRTSPLPVVYVRPKNGEIAVSEDEFVHYPLLKMSNALFEVDAVGFGALLMRRDVLDRVPEPWFTIDYRSGEDIAFCVKARKHGIKVWCDSRYKLGHLGPRPTITHADYVRYMESHPDQYADMVRVELSHAS